jgi:hypothetical protein
MAAPEGERPLAIEANKRKAAPSDQPLGVVKRGIVAAIDEACARSAPSHAFLRQAWFEAAAGGGCITALGRRPDGTLFAAIPLAPMGPRMLGMWMVPGCYWPFRSPAIATDATAEELGRMLREPAVASALGQAWRVGPVYADDPGARRLASAAKAAGWTMLKRSVGTTHLIDIPSLRSRGDWPRRSLVRKLRSHERQLAERGPVSLRFVRGEGWDGACLDALAEIEARSWVGQRTDGSGAKFLKPEQRAYWERVLEDPNIAAMLSAAILYVGVTPVAFSFDLNVGRLQYGIASSYDERFARGAPGKVIAFRHLEESEARGIEIVDWGCGDGGYKRESGAEPGPEIVDYLFVRSRPVAALLKAKWKTGTSGNEDGSVEHLLSRRDQLVLAALMTAAAAASLAE